MIRLTPPPAFVKGFKRGWDAIIKMHPQVRAGILHWGKRIAGRPAFNLFKSEIQLVAIKMANLEKPMA
jgi:hypothetical protein